MNTRDGHKGRPKDYCVDLAGTISGKKMTLALAESCTGGLVADMVTDVPDSSEYFIGGIIAYSNEVKVSLLDVPESVIDEQGAVSSETALAMARGVRNLLSADIGASATGIAGPDGGSGDKPVGLAYIAVDTPDGSVVRSVNIEGDRERVKAGVARGLLDLINDTIS